MLLLHAYQQYVSTCAPDPDGDAVPMDEMNTDGNSHASELEQECGMSWL